MNLKTIALFILSCSLFPVPRSLLHAAEATVYPYTLKATSGMPLVIREYVSGEKKVLPKKWTFPSAGYARRTVWEIPVDTNTVLEAWIDMNGNGAYDVGEPYGTSAGRDYPEFELSDASPITPRINLTADTADRGLTREEALKLAREKGTAAGIDTKWIENNRFAEGVAVADGSFRNQRVRVVRWLVNGVPVYNAGVEPRVVLDKQIETDVRTSLTEADVLFGDDGVFDLDWRFLRSEVTDNFSTIAACGEVTDVSYLIVVGDGDISWSDGQATNSVAALQTVITRRYGESHVRPVPVAPEAVVAAAEKTKFRWRIDCNDVESYTAFRIKVSQAAAQVYDSGLLRLPARQPDGTYLYEAMIPSGSNDWKIACFNSKFSDDNESYYTNGIPFTVYGE